MADAAAAATRRAQRSENDQAITHRWKDECPADTPKRADLDQTGGDRRRVPGSVKTDTEPAGKRPRRRSPGRRTPRAPPTTAPEQANLDQTGAGGLRPHRTIKTCNSCTLQSPGCSNGTCDRSWLAKAAGWTRVGRGRKWYCLSCSRDGGSANPEQAEQAKVGLCQRCLDAVSAWVSAPPRILPPAPPTTAGAEVRFLENMSCYPLASTHHLCPLSTSSGGTLSTMYPRGEQLLQTAFGKTCLRALFPFDVDAQENIGIALERSPPLGIPPLTTKKHSGLCAFGEDWRSSKADVQFCKASSSYEMGRPLAPGERLGMKEGEGVYRACKWTNLARHLEHEKREPAAFMLGHLCVSIWNSGRYRGNPDSQELFRAGCANVLLAQEFFHRKQKSALKELGFEVVQHGGAAVAVRARLLSTKLEVLAKSDSRWIRYIVARARLQPYLWSPAARELTFASVHLHNDKAKLPEAPFNYLNDFEQVVQEHAVDLVGFDLNQATTRWAARLPPETLYYMCKDAEDCAGAWLPVHSRLVNKVTRIRGRFAGFLPTDMGFEIRDRDSHYLVWMDFNWGHVRKPETEAARKERQRAARKQRRNELRDGSSVQL